MKVHYVLFQNTPKSILQNLPDGVHGKGKNFTALTFKALLVVTRQCVLLRLASYAPILWWLGVAVTGRATRPLPSRLTRITYTCAHPSVTGPTGKWRWNHKSAFLGTLTLSHFNKPMGYVREKC